MSLQCRLPDGRTVAIADEAADRLSCGVIVLDPVVFGPAPSITQATVELGERLAQQYTGLLPSEIPGLTEARNLYKAFGMDPSRHRPSSEALLRRVLKGKGLYQISNLVDACNLASLSFLLPIGMYDLQQVQGDVTLRTGLADESYPGIRKGPVNLHGRLGLFDEAGPFGSPTSDSARTCTSAATTSVLAVIMATHTYSPIAMTDNVAAFGEIFKNHCGATEVFRSDLSA